MILAYTGRTRREREGAPARGSIDTSSGSRARRIPWRARATREIILLDFLERRLTVTMPPRQLQFSKLPREIFARDQPAPLKHPFDRLCKCRKPSLFKLYTACLKRTRCRRMTSVAVIKVKLMMVSTCNYGF